MKRIACLTLTVAFGAVSFGNVVADTVTYTDGPRFPSVIPTEPADYESIDQLQTRMANGDLTSVALVERMLARIEALNKQGPQLNAVIETNPDALTIAAELDRLRAAGTVHGPLHGIPVLVKDNIDTADSMQTSAGSLAMVGEPAARDAFVVERLRLAGAVILGKSNLSEWSNFRGSNVPPGWSGRGGQTRHPYDLQADPCGSSSGSTVAVAAGFSPLSVGTETNSSIICPAYRAGVVGIRPTLGLLSRAGVIPITKRQDTPGPIARNVNDAALLLTAMVGTDARDPATYDTPHDVIDYQKLLDTGALRGKRLGYAEKRRDGSLTRLDPEFRRVASVLESAGAFLLPISSTPRQYTDDEVLLMQVDFKRELETYLQTRTGIGPKTLGDVIAFNTHTPGETDYDQVQLQSTDGLDMTQSLYFSYAEELREQARDMIDSTLRDHALDALIDLSFGALPGVGARAGYPGIIVPSGFDPAGLPTGLYFGGTRWSKSSLLSMAYAFEQERN